MKLSLGKDFFGRPYDRLSPSLDQHPQWYCERCSIHKNLQRDYRDIRTEFDKMSAGHVSEFSNPDQLVRAHLRLREIAAILSDHAGGSRLIDPAEVSALSQRIQVRTPSAAG